MSKFRSDPDPKHGRKRYRYKHLLFWACSGFIAIEDTKRNGHYTPLTIRDFRDRLAQISAIARNWTRPRERETMIRFVEDGIACIREALAQGDPTDPRVSADRLRHYSPHLHYAGANESGSARLQAAEAAEHKIILAGEFSKLPETKGKGYCSWEDVYKGKLIPAEYHPLSAVLPPIPGCKERLSPQNCNVDVQEANKELLK